MGKTRSHHGLIILIFIIIAISGYCQAKTNFLTYDNPEYRIEIRYPSDWSKTEQVMGATAAFLSPQEGTSDDFQENVMINVQDISASPMTLEQYTQLGINQIKQIITDASIIESNTTTLGGNLAHDLVFTGKQGQYNLKWNQVFTVKNNKAYVLTYTAKMNTYDNFLEAAKEIKESFRWINEN